jgi:hypothetical protein
MAYVMTSRVAHMCMFAKQVVPHVLCATVANCCRVPLVLLAVAAAASCPKVPSVCLTYRVTGQWCSSMLGQTNPPLIRKWLAALQCFST